MPITSSDASLLAAKFLGLAQAIGDFRYDHWDELTPQQHQQLAAEHWTVLNQGEDMLALSTTMVLPEAKDALKELLIVTDQAKEFLAAVADIKKGLSVTASILALAQGVVSKDPLTIEKSIQAILNKIK